MAHGSGCQDRAGSRQWIPTDPYRWRIRAYFDISLWMRALLGVASFGITEELLTAQRFHACGMGRASRRTGAVDVNTDADLATRTTERPSSLRPAA
jgi:hypothetical protein